MNADQPLWLAGIVEMNRDFGLELLETLLSSYSPVFYKFQPFQALLKERVCSLVIKLFSPNIKVVILSMSKYFMLIDPVSRWQWGFSCRTISGSVRQTLLPHLLEAS